MKDFTKELKKNWEEIYPEKAHAKMNELADQLSESVTVLGDKFLSALKKVGVTDEQIEKAKYTALGASEIAQETAEKAAKDLQAIARIKSREFKKDAAKKAEVVKAQAKDQMEVLQQKREEMKRIMRWAGPRMLWRHPILTIRHLIDDRRPAPELPDKYRPKK